MSFWQIQPGVRKRNTSWPLTNNMNTLNLIAVMLGFNKNLGRKCIIASESEQRNLVCDSITLSTWPHVLLLSLIHSLLNRFHHGQSSRVVVSHRLYDQLVKHVCDHCMIACDGQTCKNRILFL